MFYEKYICCFKVNKFYESTQIGMESFNETVSTKAQFGALDYTVFSAMLILSALCGIYFGYFKKSVDQTQKDERETNREAVSAEMNEYLLGSRKMKVFPVAMSLVGSYISGLTILGTPTEIYNFGTQYWFIVVSLALAGFTVTLVFLPVFCSLKLKSSYQYLELRFHFIVRTLASVLFIMSSIFYLPIVIYVPSLALNQVSGFNLYLIGTILCVVCVFYTLLGGMKAVVSTDVWQVVVMFISVIVIVILGTIYVGGPDVVFQRSNQGGRIKFNFSPSPYERQTFWAVLIGGFIHWSLYLSVNQTQVQRYMSLPNLKSARIAVAIYISGVIAFISVCCYSGLLVFAKYYQCDPIFHGDVEIDDQLFPHYVMDTVGSLSGMPGLFIAGVFGAALSSLSVVLNSTACVLLTDILKGCFGVQPSEKVEFWFVKCSILVLGAIALGFLFFIEKLGSILSAAQSLDSITSATTGGLFALGMLIPFSNTKGAIAGGIAGALMSGWVVFGSLEATASKKITPHKLNVSLKDCPVFINGTWIDEVIREYPDESGVFPLYRLSYHWITPIGCLTVLVVGTLVSLLTKSNKTKDIDPQLISPVLHRLLPKECFKKFGSTKRIHEQIVNSYEEK